MAYRALDLFCGAGGATKGLQMAGFHVTGVDIEPQPRYCGDEFIQADATRPPVDFRDYHFIWASPPCKNDTTAGSIARARGAVYPKLIEPTRHLLQRTGIPWVIENVPNAPLRPDITLNGYDFGIPLLRRRIVETSSPWAWNPPRGQRPAPGAVRRGEVTTVAGCLGRRRAASGPARRRPRQPWESIG